MNWVEGKNQGGSLISIPFIITSILGPSQECHSFKYLHKEELTAGGWFINFLLYIIHTPARNFIIIFYRVKSGFHGKRVVGGNLAWVPCIVR